MELFMSLASFVLSVIIIYYVVRKATRADEIVELLKKSLSEDGPTEAQKVVVEIAENIRKNVTEHEQKSFEEYLREARARAGM